MRITDLLDKRSISLDAAPKTKSEALDMAVDLMVKSEKISDREAYRKQVYLREEESTTGETGRYRKFRRSQSQTAGSYFMPHRYCPHLHGSRRTGKSSEGERLFH